MSHAKLRFKQAKEVIPGGVNSPVRSFKGVGGVPLFMSKAAGPFVWDADGRQYIDCIGAWGPMILGHGHAKVVQAIQQQAELALCLGAPTENETKLARMICELVPSIEQIRMVNSGTEAAMSAVRLARGYTKRDLIVKFAGCYHGHVDALLVKAGSAALTAGVPDSAGIPASFTQHTLIGRYNDLEHVKTLFKQYGEQIAAVILEPIAGNMNCILPVSGFLSGLRELCTDYGSVLIFDEVMTGFRVHPSGAQGLFDQQPDLSIFGKIIGGGMPVGAFGGRRDIMMHLAPEGPVYQAGTLSGNPIAVAAGLATLQQLQSDGLYDRLTATTTKLMAGMRAAAIQHGVAFTTNHVCGMFGLFFTDSDEVDSYEGVVTGRLEQFRSFFHHMLAAGVYLAPSSFESGFLSVSHDDEIIARIINAAEQAFSQL